MKQKKQNFDCDFKHNQSKNVPYISHLCLIQCLLWIAVEYDYDYKSEV